MHILKYTTFLLCLGLTASYGQGNSFLKAYGNSGYDYGRDIKQDNDTGYVITGSSSSFSSDAEAYLLKLDEDGEFLWSHNYGGTGSEWGESLVITSDSTYAIAGYTNSFGAGGFDFYLVRIDAEGLPLWEVYFGGSNWDQAFGLIQLPDGGFVLAGETYSYNDGMRSGYIVRTNDEGIMLWEHVMDLTEPSFFTDIDFDGDSIVLCGGIGDGGVDSYDGYIAKFGIDGNLGWDRTIGSEYNDQFNAVQVVDDLYSFGGSNGASFPTEKQNMWMYRLDNAGNEIYDTVFINTTFNSDAINDISIKYDQDYAYVGETKTYGYSVVDGNYDMFMAKMSPAPLYAQHSAQTYGEAGDDRGQAIDRTRDLGAVYLADTKYFSTGGNNILIVKVAPAWTYPPLTDGEDGFLVEFDDITNSLPSYQETIDLSVYPNPFNDIINIPVILEGIYSIYSIDGQLMQGGTLNSQEMNLGHFKSGIYLLTVITSDGIYKKRLIKN